MIEEIEEFRAEFNVRSLCDVGLLENCKIEVVDTLLPQRGVNPCFVAKTIACMIGKACLIEPCIDPGDCASRGVLITAGTTSKSDAGANALEAPVGGEARADQTGVRSRYEKLGLS
jgi:hypothetical protein